MATENLRDFEEGATSRKFVEAQCYEERFKQKLFLKGDADLLTQVRELEENDRFKGRIGILFPKIQESQSWDDEKTYNDFKEEFPQRRDTFIKMFGTWQKEYDPLLRKALMLSSNGRYPIKSAGKFYLGASFGNYSWTSDRPYFAHTDKELGTAFRELLDSSIVQSELTNENNHVKDILQKYINSLLGSIHQTLYNYNYTYYLINYYDEMFAGWNNCFSQHHGQLNFEDKSGLEMLLYLSTGKSNKYWDPYLYAVLYTSTPPLAGQHPDAHFKDLIWQYHREKQYAITHIASGALIWNKKDGYHINVRDVQNTQLRNEIVKELEQITDDEYLLRIKQQPNNSNEDAEDRVQKGITFVKKLLLICDSARNLPDGMVV